MIDKHVPTKTASIFLHGSSAWDTLIVCTCT